MASLMAFIDGQALPVINASVMWKLDEVARFNFTVEYAEIAGNSLYFLDAKLVYNGRIIISGVIKDDEAELELGRNGRVQAKIECYGDLGRLMCIRALTNSHFQDERVVDILIELLNNNTSDWGLGATNTMPDFNVRTTVDLRGKDTRYAQVIETVASVPELFSRFGGIVGGIYLFDIGFLGQRNPEQLVQGFNLINLKRVKNRSRRYKVLNAVGGKSSDTPVTLENAKNFDNSLLAHPTYPISQDPQNGDWIMTNNSITNGCEVRQDFDVHRTENADPPTDQEQNEAGFALWQKGVRFFEENAPRNDYTANAILLEPPEIGDTINVESSVIEKVYDRFSETNRFIQTFGVDALLRMTEVSLDFNNSQSNYDQFSQEVRHGLQYSLSLTDGDYPPVKDDGLYLLRKFERFGKNDISNSLGSGAIRQATVTNGPGEPDDCIIPDGPPNTDGKEFIVPIPATPPGATSVVATYQVDPPSAKVEVTQNPSVTPSLNWEACVSGANGADWTIASVVTVTVIFIFN